jgi:type VI secretion system protein ImpB
VLRSARPRLALRVPDRLGTEPGELAVELVFEGLEDFAPESVVRQVRPLRELLELRGQLKDLLSRMEGNDRLEQMLEQVARSAPVCARLASPSGGADADPDAADADPRAEVQG